MSKKADQAAEAIQCRKMEHRAFTSQPRLFTSEMHLRDAATVPQWSSRLPMLPGKSRSTMIARIGAFRHLYATTLSTPRKLSS